MTSCRMWHSGPETIKSKGYTKINVFFLMTRLGLFTSEVAVSGVAQDGTAVPGTFQLINWLIHSFPFPSQQAQFINCVEHQSVFCL